MTSVKKITSKATYSVRQEVLRKGKPLETCYFNGDDDATTVHFGLFQDQKLIGVVSIFQFQNPEFSVNTQFQIRGMAVVSEFQGKGFGEQLLKTVEQYCYNHKATLIWFNAREKAVSFYKKLGYKINGQSFDITDVGIHFVMYKKS